MVEMRRRRLRKTALGHNPLSVGQRARAWKQGGSVRFLGSWIVCAVACAAAIFMVPGIEVVGDQIAGTLLAALALALVNATVKPVMQLLALPATILTLGLFTLVVNAMMLELASWLSRHVFSMGIAISTFGSAMLGAIVISIVSTIVSAATGLGE